ncbi:MAG: glycosyltransferase family 2 protein [Panacagrimonas sp.]
MRRRLQTLRDLSESVQRRFGLPSHWAVLGFASRMAVSRVRAAAAEAAPASRTQSQGRQKEVILRTYGAGAEVKPATRALFVDMTGDRVELARAQLVMLALAGVPESLALGLIARSPVMHAQVAAQAADWAALLGRALHVLYLDGARASSDEDGRWLLTRMGVATLVVLDGALIHDRPADLVAGLQSESGSAQQGGAPCGRVFGPDPVRTVFAPGATERCAIQRPLWSAGGGRFGGLAPWMERGLAVLDATGRMLARVPLPPAASQARVDLCLRLPDGSLFVCGGWTPAADLPIRLSFDGVDLECWATLEGPKLDLAQLGLVSEPGARGFVALVPACSALIRPAATSRVDRVDTRSASEEGLHRFGSTVAGMAGSYGIRSSAGAGHARDRSLKSFPDSSPIGDQTLALDFAKGHSLRVALTPVEPCGERLHAANRILERLPDSHPRLREWLDRAFGPAIAALGPPPPVTAAERVIHEHGPAIAHPQVSVVVPLYGRHDFMRHQLAQFCGDPAFRQEVDLIYVIDDPRLVEAVESEAPLLARLFGLSFRTVHAGRRNLGYAGANNLGAGIARAPVLVLLNSDVIPVAPGWLRALGDTLSQAGIGMVGARLLFEDGSLQHAGMCSAPYGPWDGLPINLHPGKSLRPVPRQGDEIVKAVTGACLMLRLETWRALGGLDEGFLVGDFEDSELCARIRRRGHSIALCHDAVLVHLERQSMPSGPEARQQARRSLYNAWRADRLPSDEAVTA